MLQKEFLPALKVVFLTRPKEETPVGTGTSLIFPNEYGGDHLELICEAQITLFFSDVYLQYVYDRENYELLTEELKDLFAGELCAIVAYDGDDWLFGRFVSVELLPSIADVQGWWNFLFPVDEPRPDLSSSDGVRIKMIYWNPERNRVLCLTEDTLEQIGTEA